jgi:hypothetical protein
MTTSEVQQLIFNLTGHKVGCRKNTGSMKPYLTFQIIAKKDKFAEKFTEPDHAKILAALKMRGTFVDWYRIEIPAKYITQETPPQPKQTALF